MVTVWVRVPPSAPYSLENTMLKVGDSVVRRKGVYWEIWSDRCRDQGIDPESIFTVVDFRVGWRSLRVEGMLEYWKLSNFTIVTSPREVDLDDFM